MKNNSLLSIFLAVLVVGGYYHTTAALVALRSPTVDAARDMIGWTRETYLCCPEDYYATFAVTPQYTKSFNPNRLARCLLGNCFDDSCSKPTITISGSQVNGRGANDWLADYFGLAPDYESTVKLDPVIDSFLFDMNLFVGLDRVVSGLFLKVQAPIVHFRTQLRFSENVLNSGSLGYNAGYFGPNAIARSNLLNFFEDYIGNSFAPQLDPDNGIFLNPLTVARWGVPVSERVESTNLGDFETTLGYSFLLDEDYHLGAGITGRAPTGSKLNGLYLFEPQVGNGGHWELGGMLTGHYTFWRNDDTCRAWSLWVEGFFTHLFSANQCRTFELKNNGCSSKYMLAQKMIAPANSLLYGNGSNTPGGPTVDSIQPSANVEGIYTAVANLTHLGVTSRVALQADVAAMLSYSSGNVTFDFGYDFWYRSKDKLCLRGKTPFQKELWALKGDAYTYGFGASNAVIGANANIALSATESLATIHAGTNTPIGSNFNNDPTSSANQLRNPGIDNPQFGVTSNIIVNTTDRINYLPGATATDLNQQRTSVNPVILTNDDIDIAKEENTALSNKVFAHFNYIWEDEFCVTPYFGFGGSVEWAHTSCGDKKTVCTAPSAPKINCGVSQWAIWLKTGISF